jgi:hypothetical protein
MNAGTHKHMSFSVCIVSMSISSIQPCYCQNVSPIFMTDILSTGSFYPILEEPSHTVKM